MPHHFCFSSSISEKLKEAWDKEQLIPIYHPVLAAFESSISEMSDMFQQSAETAHTIFRETIPCIAIALGTIPGRRCPSINIKEMENFGMFIYLLDSNFTCWAFTTKRTFSGGAIQSFGVEKAPCWHCVGNLYSDRRLLCVHFLLERARIAQCVKRTNAVV